MKAFLIEDEAMARNMLARTITEHFPDIEIAGTAGTVREAVEWLKTGRPDITFMDVELSDGKSFEILKKTQIPGHIIMTTAYDNYAVKAFETGCIDYLLKPIDRTELMDTLDRIIEEEIGLVFAKVLEHCAVFADTEEGHIQFEHFAGTV